MVSGGSWNLRRGEGLGEEAQGVGGPGPGVGRHFRVEPVSRASPGAGRTPRCVQCQGTRFWEAGVGGTRHRNPAWRTRGLSKVKVTAGGAVG